MTITVQGGVVTLSGTVRNRMVKFAAYSDAFWTYGVTDVRNELAIKGQGAPAAAAAASPTTTAAVPATQVDAFVPAEDDAEATEATDELDETE